MTTTIKVESVIPLELDGNRMHRATRCTLFDQSVLSIYKNSGTYFFSHIRTKVLKRVNNLIPLISIQVQYPLIASLHSKEGSHQLQVYNTQEDTKQIWDFNERALQCFLNSQYLVVLFHGGFYIFDPNEISKGPQSTHEINFFVPPNPISKLSSGKYFLLANQMEMEIWDISEGLMLFRYEAKSLVQLRMDCLFASFLVAKFFENICVVVAAEEFLIWQEGFTDIQRMIVDQPPSSFTRHKNHLIIGDIHGGISVYSIKGNRKLYEIYRNEEMESEIPLAITEQIKFRIRELLILSDEFLLVSFETGEFSLWSLNDKEQKKPAYEFKVEGTVSQMYKHKGELYCLLTKKKDNSPPQDLIMEGHLLISVIPEEDLYQTLQIAALHTRQYRDRLESIQVKDFLRKKNAENTKPTKNFGEDISPEKETSAEQSRLIKKKKLMGHSGIPGHGVPLIRRNSEFSRMKPRKKFGQEPQIDYSGNPKMEISGSPKMENSGKTKLENSGKIKLENTGKPKNGNSGKPKMEIPENPKIENPEIPEIEPRTRVKRANSDGVLPEPKSITENDFSKIKKKQLRKSWRKSDKFLLKGGEPHHRHQKGQRSLTSPNVWKRKKTTTKKTKKPKNKNEKNFEEPIPPTPMTESPLRKRRPLSMTTARSHSIPKKSLSLQNSKEELKEEIFY